MVGVTGRPVTRPIQQPTEAAPTEPVNAPAPEAPVAEATPAAEVPGEPAPDAVARAGAARQVFNASGADLRASLEAQLPKTSAPAATPAPTDPAAPPADVPREPYTLSTPTISGDTAYTTATIGNRSISIRTPKDPGPGVPTADEVAKSLAAMPATLRDTIKRVDVKNQANPADKTYWPDDPDFKSYMTAQSDGVVSIYPSDPKPDQKVQDGALVHEASHLLADGTWGQDTSDPRWNSWREAMQKDGAKASEYAKRSVAEDFAETMEAYQGVKGTPAEAEMRAQMPQRMAAMDALLAKDGVGAAARLANQREHAPIRPHMMKMDMMDNGADFYEPEPVCVDPKGFTKPSLPPTTGRG